jgi:hypothetical protein
MVPRALVELHAALEDLALSEDHAGSFEPVTLTDQLVDDVDLDAWIVLQILDGSG